MNRLLCWGLLLAPIFHITCVIQGYAQVDLERIRGLLEHNEVERRLEGIDAVSKVGEPLLPDLLPLLADQRPARNVAPDHTPYVARVSELAAFTVHNLFGVSYPTFLDTRYPEWIEIGVANARRLVREPAWAAYLRSVAPLDSKGARPHPIGWFRFDDQLVPVDLFRSPDEEIFGVAVTAPAAEAERRSELVDLSMRLRVWILTEDGTCLSSLDEPTERRGLFFRNGGRIWAAPSGFSPPGHVLFSFCNPPGSADIIAAIIQNGDDLQALPIRNVRPWPLSDENVWLYRLNTLVSFARMRDQLIRDPVSAEIVALRDSLLKRLEDLGREATYDETSRQYILR